jgi:hypothetical protein
MAGNKAKGCVKLRRISKLKNYYAAGHYRTDANRKKKMGRHIRHNPLDLKAIHHYEHVIHAGDASGHIANATSKGKELLRRKEYAEARG